VRRNNCYISERHFSVCGIIESSKDTVSSNIADQLQKIGCDNLITCFEGKCIYSDYYKINSYVDSYVTIKSNRNYIT